VTPWTKIVAFWVAACRFIFGILKLPHSAEEKCFSRSHFPRGTSCSWPKLIAVSAAINCPFVFNAHSILITTFLCLMLMKSSIKI